MTTADYLTQLQQDREDLVDNLETMGISGLSGDETFTELVPEVLNISGGGSDYNVKMTSTISSADSGQSGRSILLQYITEIPTIDVSNILYGNATGLFYWFAGLTSIEVIGGQNIINATSMFYYTSSLNSLKINLSNATDLRSCFNNSNLNDFSNVTFGQPTDVTDIFNGSKATTLPYIDLSKATSIKNAFRNNANLVNVPAYDLSSVNASDGFNNAFMNCNNLSNDSLNNILAMCASATNYNGTKTLYNVFGGSKSSVYPASTVQALSNYQDFIDAGWTIGWN